MHGLGEGNKLPGPEAGRSGNHDRLHDPLSTKKANVNIILFFSFPRRQFGF